MFKLHRHKSDRSGDRIDFKFSNFNAIQVPKGWDKLLVSLVSADTGRAIAKLGKASVRNGMCRWTDTLTETIWIVRNDGDKQEHEECRLKFVVAMGSSRSGILGEAYVNLARYASSRATVPFSLPLSKCDHGTTLQFKIQCLTPRSKVRDEQRSVSNSRVPYVNPGYDDTETKSDASDGSFPRSMGSSSSNHLESTSQAAELSSRDPTFSASSSRHSLDSTEGSSSKDVSSPRNNLFGVANNLIGRQDSAGSQCSTPSHGLHSPDDDNRSKHRSFNSKVPGAVSTHRSLREDHGENASVLVSSSLQNADSSKDLLEAAELTTEELRAEARMWERNAKKLMAEVDELKEQLSDHLKNEATLDMELSASQRECNNMKQEMEQLTSLLDESSMKEKAAKDMKLQAEDMDEMQRQLEDEINSYKESNDHLAQQLQKTQESNIELLSILQELEGIVEAQKLEIENLSAQKSKSKDIEETSQNLDFSALKMGKMSSNSDIEGSAFVHPLRESSSDLQIQLHDMLEKQKNLEGTIQMLEKTLQDKNIEIEMAKELSTRNLQDCETKWRFKLAAKEEEILNLEAKLREAITGCQLRVSEFGNGEDGDLSEEVSFLRAKVEELEKDCCELTEENLQLLLKLKEAKMQILPSSSFLCSPGDSPADISTIASENDVSLLESQLLQLQRELKRKEDLIEEFATCNSAKSQCTDVEKRYNEMEIQLQRSKDEAFHLEHELEKYRGQVEAQVNEIQVLQEQLQHCGTKEALTTNPHQLECDIDRGLNHSTQSSHFLSELCEELHHFVGIMKKQQLSLHMSADANKIDSFDVLEAKLTEQFTDEEQVQLILKHLSELNKLSVAHCNGHNEFQLSQKEVHAKGLDVFMHNDLKEDLNDTSNQDTQSSETDPERTLEDLSKEIAVEFSQAEQANADRLLDEEIELLRRNLTDLESQFSGLQKENRQLEESLETMEREKGISSKHAEDLKNEMTVLNTEMKFQAEANKDLERKSEDLEKGKQDLELQLSDMEEENLQLSERISALEAQLRHLTNEKEKCRLELEHFESHATSLHEEIRRLENEMEAQKMDMKQKLQEMQKRWLESQEECEFLKKANPKLQATAENLIEECAALQKSNGDLRRQNAELHKHNIGLEAELKDSRERFSKCSEKVEALEAELSSMIEEIPLKEESLKAELECLVDENKEQKEKLLIVERLLNQMYADKIIEVENLQKELVHLIDQISDPDVGKEGSSSEAVVSALRADKGRLEASLQDLQDKYASCESKLVTLQRESEVKVEGLMSELNASRQNQSALMADHDRMLVLLERIRTDEKRCKSIMNELELKFKASEYERLQLVEEISGLKLKLQNAGLLQDEVLALKNSLNNANFENERMKASLDLLSGDYEQLKAEKSSLAEKIACIETGMVELEEYRLCKIALEEKVLRLEGDLAAREVACSQDAELKIELGKFKRGSNELLRQIKHLEEDKEEYLKRVQSLEEELKQKHDMLQDQSQLGCVTSDLSGKSEFAACSTRYERRAPGISDKASIAEPEGADYISKIQSLENELAEALEANDMYKAQLRRFLSEEQSNHPDTENIGANETKNSQSCDRDISSLEIELRDLRERYFQISLKYAEVEAQREELVLKLKSMNKRSWFS